MSTTDNDVHKAECKELAAKIMEGNIGYMSDAWTKNPILFNSSYTLYYIENLAPSSHFVTSMSWMTKKVNFNENQVFNYTNLFRFTKKEDRIRQILLPVDGDYTLAHFIKCIHLNHQYPHDGLADHLQSISPHIRNADGIIHFITFFINCVPSTLFVPNRN
jgi:hypothetical protein